MDGDHDVGARGGIICHGVVERRIVVELHQVEALLRAVVVLCELLGAIEAEAVRTVLRHLLRCQPLEARARRPWLGWVGSEA
jgi:hypothetical protein